jgi:N-acetylmuramoyl-L-alanine amidase
MGTNWIQDAGHGGADPGAAAKGNIEKNYTLEATLYVDKRLGELGIGSHCSRTSDVTLEEDDRVAKVSKYKYCISHHFNAGDGDGVETIHSIYADGKFEHNIIDEFKEAGYPIRNRSVYFRKGLNGDYYYMHRRTGKCRTTIVEYDFVDGPNADKIKDRAYREGMYECVIKAICRQEGVAYKSPKQPKKEASGVFYRVVTGSFKDRKNADERIAALKKAGFDSFIDVYKK